MKRYPANLMVGAIIQSTHMLHVHRWDGWYIAGSDGIGSYRMQNKETKRISTLVAHCALTTFTPKSRQPGIPAQKDSRQYHICKMVQRATCHSALPPSSSTPHHTP